MMKLKYLIIVHRLHLIHVRGKMMSERLGGARFLQQLEFPALFAVLRYRATHTDPESNRLVKKVQKSKSLYSKIALITFVEDFLEHNKLIFFIS